MFEQALTDLTTKYENEYKEYHMNHSSFQVPVGTPNALFLV